MVTGIHIYGDEDEQQLLQKAFVQICSENTSDTFIFFTEKNIRNLPPNCIEEPLIPSPKNRLLLYYWYRYKLPKLLLKYGIETYISSVAFPIKTKNVQQFLFLNKPIANKSNNPFFNSKFLETVKSANKIFVKNEVIKAELLEKYKADEQKINCLHFNHPDQFLPLTWTEAENNKQLYAEGFDYFLFPVTFNSADKIITVLKAFSQFKKWQKSSIKLVLLVKGIENENLISDFKNYKYRDEVKIIKETSENRLPIIASAFAMLFLGNYEDVAIVFAAMQNNIAVITANNKTNNLLFSDAVLAATISENDIAQKMQLIYKDEFLKNALLQKAAFFLTKYDTVNTSQKMYELLSGK